MHYAITRGQEGRRLDARTDIAGGQFTMAQNVVSNLCGPGRMIPRPETTCAPTPELLVFAAETISETEVRASWSLDSNFLVTYFILERSKDAAAWHELSTVPATETANSYTFSWVMYCSHNVLSITGLGAMATSSGTSRVMRSIGE